MEKEEGSEDNEENEDCENENSKDEDNNEEQNEDEDPMNEILEVIKYKQNGLSSTHTAICY